MHFVDTNDKRVTPLIDAINMAINRVASQVVDIRAHLFTSIFQEAVACVSLQESDAKIESGMRAQVILVTERCKLSSEEREALVLACIEAAKTCRDQYKMNKYEEA